MPAARTDMRFEALEPKCLVITSIHIKESQDINIPPSKAMKSSCSSVLLAKRFMEITLTTNKVTTVDGILLIRSFMHLASHRRVLFIFDISEIP